MIWLWWTGRECKGFSPEFQSLIAEYIVVQGFAFSTKHTLLKITSTPMVFDSFALCAYLSLCILWDERLKGIMSF
jgi:hypothetical protein